MSAILQNNELLWVSITLNTAKTHRKNIIHKLRCKNNAELMYYQVFG